MRSIGQAGGKAFRQRLAIGRRSPDRMEPWLVPSLSSRQPLRWGGGPGCRPSRPLRLARNRRTAEWPATRYLQIGASRCALLGPSRDGLFRRARSVCDPVDRLIKIKIVGRDRRKEFACSGLFSSRQAAVILMRLFLKPRWPRRTAARPYRVLSRVCECG